MQQLYGQTNIGIIAAKGAMALCLCALLFSSDYLISFAHAQSARCDSLNAQLRQLSLPQPAGGNSRKYRQFNQAITKQRQQISKARRALRANGCVGIFRNAKRACRSINSSLKKMESNLQQLQRQRAQFAPRQANASERRRQILIALRQNGCIAGVRSATVQPPQKPRRRTLLEQIFGVRTYSDRGRRFNDDIGADTSLWDSYNTYRTLCVRKSDGYYFPISFSTVPDRFDQDEQTCFSMCPSSEVALYVHRIPQEDSEDMISFRTEQYYADEPFAFAYRKEHNPENNCRFATDGFSDGFETFTTTELEPLEKPEVRIGIPNFRKSATLSPDEFDNAMNNFTTQDAMQYVKSSKNKDGSGEGSAFANGRKVRIVGPAFFPVQ